MAQPIISTNTNQAKTNLPPPGDKLPVAVPLTFDFSVATSYQQTLSIFQQQGNMGGATSMFVDNSASAAKLTITLGGSGQTIIAPAGAQGYVRILAPNPLSLVATCLSGTLVTLQLLNIDIATNWWYPNSTAGGVQLVSDVALDAIISNGALATNNKVVGSGGVLEPNIVGNLVAQGSLTAAGASATIITGSPGYWLKSISLQLDPLSTVAAGASFLVTVNDSSAGVISLATFFVPAAAPTLTAAAVGPRWTDADSFEWNNKVANSTLTITLPVALTAGSLKYMITYAITSFVG